MFISIVSKVHKYYFGLHMFVKHFLPFIYCSKIVCSKIAWIVCHIAVCLEYKGARITSCVRQYSIYAKTEFDLHNMHQENMPWDS